MRLDRQDLIVVLEILSIASILAVFVLMGVV
jgi:hypothetical protein